MTSEQDAQSRWNGQLAACRQTFGQVLDLLDDTQVETLLALVTANLASLRGLWMDRHPRSAFREELLRELEVQQFFLRERLKFGPRKWHNGEGESFMLVCARCDALIDPRVTPIEDIACPFCKRSDWIFGTHCKGDPDATDA